MKTQRCEHMHELLFLISEPALERAYRIRSKNDIRQYAKEKARANAARSLKGRALCKALTAVACFALVIGILLSPSLWGTGVPVTPNGAPPVGGLPPSDHTFTIESIDMVNYYSAMRIMEDTDEQASMSTDTRYPVQMSVKEAVDTVYYEELSPTAVFTVTGAVFFRIQVDDEACFLASKVGTGTVDVVITENNFEPMITFKNGDRFFTCCQNAGYIDGMLFSTHKYIEGFYFAKNFGQKNYSFRIYYNDFTLDYQNSKALRIETYESITDLGEMEAEFPVVGDTLITNKRASFTIAELERYFNESSIPCAAGAKNIFE